LEGTYVAEQFGATQMTDAAKEMLELYKLPFKVVGGSIRDANDGYVAELSGVHGSPMRDAMAAFLVECANRSAASAPSQTAREADIRRTNVELAERYNIDLAALPPVPEAPSQAIVAGGVLPKGIRETLEHARVRFECLAEEFDKAGDNVSWAMCSVDAERMSRALAAPEPQRGTEG
jgi:hypothetical protein